MRAVVPALLGAGGGTFLTLLGALAAADDDVGGTPPRLPTKSLMNPSFFWMSARLIPILDSWSSNALQLGSTFSAEKPFSAVYPMWATCLKSDGAPIIDLSILPPFPLSNLLPLFFFDEDEEEPLANFCLLLIFLCSSAASPSSANANPIMYSSLSSV